MSNVLVTTNPVELSRNEFDRVYYGLIAQRSEQRTHNSLVPGSNPGQPNIGPQNAEVTMSRHSIWPDGSCPVYINPTFQEIVELAETKPDTLRILDSDNEFAVASGFGNTHYDIMKVLRLQDRNTMKFIDLILFRRAGEWFWNDLGHWGSETCKIRLSSKMVAASDPLQKFVTDFVNCYNDL